MRIPSSPLSLLVVPLLLILVPLVAPPRASAVPIDGIVIAEGTGPLMINVIGDLVLYAPDGLFTVDTVFELLAVESTEFEAGQGTITIMAETIVLFAPFPGAAYPDPDAEYAGDPFHITLAGPLVGPLQIFSSGSILLTNMPIPEPTTAVLIAGGLVLLAGRRR